MKNKPKTISDINNVVLNRKGEEGSALKENERVMSTAEMIFLHDMDESGKELLEKNHLDVWFLQSNVGDGGLESDDVRNIYAFERSHNKKVTSSDDLTLREYRFKIYDVGDFSYYLEQAYQNPAMIREIPEVVVIHSKPADSDGAWTGIGDMIKGSIEKCLDRLNHKKDFLAEHVPEYFNEADRLEVEKRLLKPVVVFVSDDPVRQELMRENGADIVLKEFSHDNMQELLEITAKMKASAATIVPEKLRFIKSEFYQSVEKSLDTRSKVTAETEKEIEILDDIFKRAVNIHKVLDIACGYGRIDIPLLERGYAVTGVDANEQFLQDALRKSFEKNLN